MQPHETVEEYVMRGNGAVILPYQVIATLVKELPGDLEGLKMA